jgi:cytoskeletal protein RodZ
VVGDAVQSRTVQVTIDTQPAGASVSIDGFALPGTTPIKDAPVTAREGRQVEITLPGYQPVVTTVNLTQDRTLSYTLTPTPQAAAPSGPSNASVTPSSVGPNQIGINITARTWLEVYQSTTRNQGDRLVYATVDAGQHYVFDLPVYLHVGNAAGVDIVVGGKDLGAMGSPGAVVSRAYPAP